MRLQRQPGRKEPRYAQLLSGVPEISESDLSDLSDLSDGQEFARTAPERRAKAAPAGERLGRLESDIALLREETAVLRQEIEALVASFG
jgi:uncharacterized protein YceH (UPF0502 family)